MTAPLLVVTGTGTGIGKTQLTAALLVAWARLLGVTRRGVVGLKPVETGVVPGQPSDRETLERASTFHVKRSPAPYMLTRAVSPHLAARDEGRRIELGPITRYVDEARAAAGGVAVELAGGLFSPLARGLSNADVLQALAPDAAVLVAPDRLGVLHDVAATTRAASAAGLRLRGIILVAPQDGDSSTGTNAAELGVVTDLPVLAVVPRADVATLALREDLIAVVASLVGPAR